MNALLPKAVVLSPGVTYLQYTLKLRFDINICKEKKYQTEKGGEGGAIFLGR